jgi:hypothetical protein
MIMAATSMAWALDISRRYEMTTPKSDDANLNNTKHRKTNTAPKHNAAILDLLALRGFMTYSFSC